MTDSPSAAPGRIFISYRRQDSAYPAGWLYDRLAERFGPDQVFKDVDSIELGDDFVETITSAVGSCDILLALIGEEWLDVASADGTRRLDDPDDFVRLEIEAALQRKVLLIPILVDGATMPRADQLPPSIAPMVRRQALELSPSRFRLDTQHLLDVMERTLADIHGDQPEGASAAPAEAPVTPEPEPTKAGRPGNPRRMLVAAGVAVAVVAVLVAVILNARGDDPNKPGDASAKPTSTSTATPTKLGGPDAPIVLAHRGGDEEFAWQTVPAFEHAARLGAQVETDVRWTKDDVAVLMHDAGTTPGMECEGGNLRVAETEWSVLDTTCHSAAIASKDGQQYGIPTFAEGIAAIAQVPDAQVYPEVKVKQGARQVRHFVETIKNARMIDRTVVTSTFPDELAKIRAEAEAQGEGNLRTMLFVSGDRPPAAELGTQGLWGVAVKADIITEEYVTTLHDEELKVMMWIVNTPTLWQEAADVGADLILTDKPAAFGKWAEAS